MNETGSNMEGGQVTSFYYSYYMSIGHLRMHNIVVCQQ